MKTRTRHAAPGQSEYIGDDLFTEEEHLELESLSDDELEALLFADEPVKSNSPLNLPTVAGLSLIGVGILYMLERMGMAPGIGIEPLVQVLPWLAGVLIILLGFGVLSWRPGYSKRKARKRAQARAKAQAKAAKAAARARRKAGLVDAATTAASAAGTAATVAASAATKAASSLAGRKRGGRLTKSRDKKLAGVAGGLAEYFGIDPTVVRIAFVVGMLMTSGAFIMAYILLAFVMPSPPRPTLEERITIIRES